MPRSATNPRGIIIMNSGTPDSPTPEDIRPYLKEYLSDRHLIDLPPFIWQPILRTFILPKRPYRSAERYQQIWTDEGSPLLIESLKQERALQEALDASHPGSYLVKLGMRYGNPNVDDAIEELCEAGCKDILVIPLFPQTAFSTTRTCIDKVAELSKRYPDLRIRSVTGYSTHNLYIQALVDSIQQAWTYEPGSKLIFAFHSVPCKHIEKGDTYVEEITASMREASKQLDLPDEGWAVAFQSRFEDSRKWIGPGMMHMLQDLAQAGTTRVAVVTPGFAVECLETKYDCDIEQRKFFETLCKAQGLEADFTYIPPLNDHPLLISLLANIATQQSSGE